MGFEHFLLELKRVQHNLSASQLAAMVSDLRLDADLLRKWQEEYVSMKEEEGRRDRESEGVRGAVASLAGEESVERERETTHVV